MMYRCFSDLVVYSPETVIKVEDTNAGIAEGRAVGCITVGISLTGNDVGLSEADLAALPWAERRRLNKAPAKNAALCGG